FGFSGFVMKALARVRPAHGIAAMQLINVMAVTPPLMIALFGTALACVALIVSSLVKWREPVAMFRLMGGGVYLVGAVLVTMLFNVPLNNALAAVDPDSSEGATQWTRYVPRWTAWNTVRTVAAIVASALLTLALVAGRTEQLLDAARTR
ncbi:MAG: DUF1772 domain-containing protein, partial [Chloroflexi bacterium]|nr:DUF1772 domain-containing protein [Chloroflexota bacterium]